MNKEQRHLVMAGALLVDITCKTNNVQLMGHSMEKVLI